MKLPSFVMDRVVRHQVGLHKTPLNQFTIRVARTLEDYTNAFHLVHAVYGMVGLEDTRPNGMRVLPQHILPESTVLVAYEGDQIVASMTIIEDSPAGLPIDKQFGDKTRELRRSGARLVEFASLAVARPYWRSGVTQLLAMAAYQFAYNQLNATHTVITTRPPGVPYYRAMFNFSLLSPARKHSELHTECYALVQDMTAVRGWFGRMYNKPLSDGRMPYDHFAREAPACIELPPANMSSEDFARWKLPRDLFQALFVEAQRNGFVLDRGTHKYLEQKRSRETLMGVVPPRRATTLSDAN